jgi:hypothetical protein
MKVLHRALASIMTELAVMPWERKATLVGLGLLVLPWWVVALSRSELRDPETYVGFAVLVLFWGVIILVSRKALGRFDYRVSGFVPSAFSRWWGDATAQTAESWWLYLGILWVTIAALDFIAGLVVELLRITQ